MKRLSIAIILLSLDGRVLANREPLHVVATDVTSWLASEDAEPVATLDACAIAVREPVDVPEG